jgi:putative acyl-CoA dehydrogenase
LLRALRRREGRDSGSAEVVQALDTELATARGASPLFDQFANALFARLADAADRGDDESGARRLAQDVALAVQGSLLRRHAPQFMFDAFCRSRLAGGGAQVFGTLPAGLPLEAIIGRAMPH